MAEGETAPNVLSEALKGLCDANGDDREAVCDAARRVSRAVLAVRGKGEGALGVLCDIVETCSSGAQAVLGRCGVARAMDIDAGTTPTSTSFAPLKQAAVDAAALVAAASALGRADAALAAAAVVVSAKQQHALDALLARAYYVADVLDCSALDTSRRMVALREASVGHAPEAAAVLANGALRVLIASGDMAGAARLLSRTCPDDGRVCAATAAKRQYYAAIVAAVVSADYCTARDMLGAAAAKTHGCARGFRAAVQRLLLVVDLLLGADVARGRFDDASALPAPYLALSRAVRAGDLSRFEAVALSGAALFAADGTAALVSRLPARVVQTGVRRVAAAYRRISVDAVQRILGLPARADVLAVLRKAIADGLIVGDVAQCALPGSTVRTECLVVRTPHRAYYAAVPTQAALDGRIRAAAALHGACVKSMRYAAGAHETGVPGGHGQAARRNGAAGADASEDSANEMSLSDMSEPYMDEDLI